MKWLGAYLLVSLFFLSNAQNKSGGLYLQIDRANAPANIVEVIAYLSQYNYDTLSCNLNLLSGPSADIAFENIAVGEWHLKVDAINSDGVIVYAGETDISILAGITTQVNLPLIPTGKGTGSVYISVNWGGLPNHGWIDYQRNPIFKNHNSPSNQYGVTQSKILYEDGIYKMWFVNLFNSAIANIDYVESYDGINWKNVNPDAVLTSGAPGSWDDYSVGVGAVIKDGSEYKMYYSGYQDQHEKWHIGLATSTDGICWDKRPQPVLYATNNEHQIGTSEVIKINNMYYMYYTVRHYPYYNINLATSTDGINWIRYPNNPVLRATESWESTGIYNPSVIYEGNQFKMVYMNAKANGFGMALSSDGKHWIKNNGNPFFTPNQSSNNWTHDIAYPCFRKHDNEYRIYYTGTSYSGKIGLLRKFN